jgi:hypothetical protein
MVREKTTSIFIFFLILILLFSGDLYSQRRKVYNLPKYDIADYHFGFMVGLNQMNFTVKPASNIHTRVFSSEYTPDLNVDSSMLLAVNSTPTLGFLVGIVGDKRLGRYFNLRFTPTLSFGERYLNYSILGYDTEGESIIEIQKNIPSAFLDFPFFVKYKSKRLNNVRAYVLAGVQYTLDLASNAKRRDETAIEVVKLKKHDVYGLIGVGFDFYNNWFKFGVELRMNFGIMDVLQREETIYTEGIDRLTSKVLQLAMTFE